MNALPRTPIASRLQAVLAAVTLTVAMLSGIDALAVHEAGDALVAQTSTSQST